MPDLIHEAFERHIDTQHPDLSKTINAIQELRDLVSNYTYNFNLLANPSLEPGVTRANVNMHFIELLQLAGYGYSLIAPRTAVGTVATSGIPFSVFNNGAKTLVVYDIVLSCASGAPAIYQILGTSTDPTFNTSMFMSNHKLGEVTTNIDATFNSTTIALPPIDNTTLFTGQLANPSTTEILLTSIIILPAGLKRGFTIWASPPATTSVTVGAQISVVELPF